jgi:8-oxo-dGTP pyrophosphatase MutT (NUDIX family)
MPITADKKVLAIRQFRHGANNILIELPGGNKHPKESRLNAAKRELLEETGFCAKKISVLKPGKIWFDPSVLTSYYFPCLAIDCYPISNPQLDTTECIETITIPINEWLDMIYAGLITDNKTLATTFLSLPHIGIRVKNR